MRIFIALDVSSKIRGQIKELTDRLREFAPEARWARVEGLHLTLKFVGHVSDAKVVEISNALRTIKKPSFEVTFGRVAFFPSARSPRVFWIGAEGDELRQLARAIESKLETLSIPHEKRKYSPHLTLARSGTKPNSLKRLSSALERQSVPNLGTMSAREFWLYHSQPGRGGSVYTQLEAFSLDASGAEQG